ncbi:MAG: hypothetical protein ACREJU_08970 [Nitrospiraceae bacterium]
MDERAGDPNVPKPAVAIPAPNFNPVTESADVNVVDVNRRQLHVAGEVHIDQYPVCTNQTAPRPVGCGRPHDWG